MKQSKNKIYNLPGVSIETIVDNKVYLLRGHKDGESYPADYTQLMLAVIDDNRVEFKGAKAFEKIRKGQAKAVLGFFKGMGITEYQYERSNGKSFRMKTCVL